MASLVKTDKISKIAGGSQEFVLPGADGTANQHLKTDGAGNLGWASPPTGVALTGSTNTWIPTITGADALTGTANFTYDGNTLDVKNSGTASSINLYCETSNLHYIKLKSGPHASATSYTLTLPNAPPSVSGHALTATTGGVASWAAVGGDNTPAFLALGPGQTLSHDTSADVTMNNELYDTDSAYNAGTSKFTVPAGEAGKYLVYGQVSFNASASQLGLSATTVVKIPSGGSAIGQIYNNSSFKNNYGNAMTCTFDGVLDLGVGDVVYINCIADTGNSSNITVVGDQGTDRYYTYWGMHKLIGI